MPKKRYFWWDSVKQEIREYPKTNSPNVERAMEFLRRTPEGMQAIQILKYVYFKKRNTIGGTAALLGIPERTATRRVKKAFMAVAKEMGYW